MQDDFQLTLPNSSRHDLWSRCLLLESGCGTGMRIPEHAVSSGDPGSLPERLQLARSGRWRFGIRLGFPEFPEPESLHKAFSAAEILSSITMEQPSGFDNVNSVDLAKAAWAILSTHIVPDLARSLRNSLSGEAGGGGTGFELDLIITTDLSEDIGFGLLLTIQH